MVKKIILTFIGVLSALLCFSVASQASTLESLDIYLKYNFINRATREEQTAPTSMTDAGEERINQYSGTVSYYKEELNLPGINGLDLVIGRKFNSASDADLNGKLHYVSVTGYNYPNEDGLELAEGKKYVFPYYLDEECTGEPIFIGYDTVWDMLEAESDTLSISVVSDYADDMYDLSYRDFINYSSEYSQWSIDPNFSAGLTLEDEFCIYGEVSGTGVILYRDVSKQYDIVYSVDDDTYYYKQGESYKPEIALGGGWEYSVPSVIGWEQDRVEDENADCIYGLFYDPYTRMNVNFQILYNGTRLVDARTITYYPLSIGGNSMYEISVENLDSGFVYYITRYDGVKFYCSNQDVLSMEDRFGNKIEYSYPAAETISITDTLGRNVVLTKLGISVDGDEIVSYTHTRSNNDIADPNNFYEDDDSCIFTANYKVATNKYKQIVYNMSQRGKTYQVLPSGAFGRQTASYSKAVVDQVTLPTGAKRFYGYGKLEREFTDVIERQVGIDEWSQVTSYHTFTDYGCTEKYETQYNSTTLENQIAFTYDGKLKTIITYPNIDGYTITETYDRNGNLDIRVTECTDGGYTLTEEFSYTYGDGIYLLSGKEVTKEMSDGVTSNYRESYAYQYNKLESITRNSKEIYLATYASTYGLPETEYNMYGTDEYRGVNNTISDGNIVLKEYVTLESRRADPVVHETTSYTYDSYGNLASIDGDGVNVEYSYEYGDYSGDTDPPYSLILTETYPLVDNITDSEGTEIPSANVQKKSYYDKWGNLVKVVDGEGNVTTFTYDYLGRVLTQKNADNKTKTYRYKDDVNQIYIVNEDGSKNLNAFDTLGREKGYYYLDTDRSVYAIIYFKYYNANSFLTKHSTYVNGAADSATWYAYYSDGSVKKEVLRETGSVNGATITSNTYTYGIPEENVLSIAVMRKKNDTENVTFTSTTTPCGYKLKDIINDGSEEFEQVYTTDVVGNITEVEDLRGNIAHTYTYDYRGRVTVDDFAIGSKTNVYDGAFLYQVKDAENTVVKTYEYNTMGKVIRETTPIDDDSNNVTEYYYDRNGNMTKTVTTTGDGTTTKTATTTYDSLNRPVAVNDGSGYYTRYEYDSGSRVVRMATGVATATEALDRNTHAVTDYEYSYRGFLTSVTDPMGFSESYTYDSQGTMLTYTDKNGTEFEHEYNGALWLLSKTATGTNGSTKTVSYEYDNLGSVTKMIDENGTTVYTYDGFGNVLTETRGALTKTYTYDENGNRLSSDITNGSFSQNLTYTYDKNNRVTRVTDDKGYTKYTYDDNNRILTETTYYSAKSGTGALEKYTYYDSGLLETKKNYRYTAANTSYLVDDYALTYYADGNIATVDNNDAVTNYVYDAAGRLVSESVDGEVTASYTYDARGNRASKTETDGVTTYTYDKNNCLTAENTSLNDGTTSYNYYCYNNDGTLQEKYWGISHAMYDYDLFGCLVTWSSEEAYTTYTYDGNGLRQSKTVGGVTTSFINDGGYVIGEICGDNIVEYTYGLDLISIENNGVVGYYHTDEHGNVSAITDTSRAVVADYDFDAFGNESTTNTYYNPMRYCGEYSDAETGLIYLRARYYDPSIGRFISVDPIKDGTNWYVYCSNNPVMFVDPSGKITQEEQQMYENGELSPMAYTYLMELTYNWYLADTDDQRLFFHQLAETFRGNNYETTNGLYPDVDEGIAYMPNKPTVFISIEEHYFRNELNIQFEWDTFQKLQERLPDNLKWKKLPDKEARFHRFTDSGNTKYVSHCEHFEMIFNPDNELINESRAAIDMGTYNYYGPTQRDMHNKYDVSTWWMYGNTEDSAWMWTKLIKPASGLIWDHVIEQLY